jgi:hypothetical protein
MVDSWLRPLVPFRHFVMPTGTRAVAAVTIRGFAAVDRRAYGGWWWFYAP